VDGAAKRNTTLNIYKREGENKQEKEKERD